MAKGKVRMSNWAAATLKPKQKLYAATDAYASYALATKLYKMLSDDNRNKLPLFHVDSDKDQSRMREPKGNKSNVCISKVAYNGAWYSSFTSSFKRQSSIHISRVSLRLRLLWSKRQVHEAEALTT